MKIKQLFASAVLAIAASSAFAVPVVLTIEFDDFASETAFGIWDSSVAPTGADYFADPGLAFDGIAYDVAASSDIGFGDGFVLPGDFAGEPGGVPFTFVWDLGIGDYTFIILDTFGDGICCGFGDGSYSLTVDGIQVGAGGEFAEFEITEFGVVTSVPEPGMLGLLALGLMGFGAARLRK